MRTLQQVATDLNLYAAMEDPVLWLKRQRRAGRIRARKVGRVWMMTDADVKAAVEAWGDQPAPVVEVVADEVPHMGLTAASMRRREAS